MKNNSFVGVAKTLQEGGSEILVDQRKILDPVKAYENMQRALGLVKGAFGRVLKVDLNEVHFKSFGGNVVGESTESGTFIDPVMLLHPAHRFAHVLGHELAHNNNEIQNEALVDSYVESVLGESGISHPYEEAVAKFEVFVARLGGDKKAATQKIYELYYSGNYEAIYEEYERNYCSTLQSDKEKIEAMELFNAVFPELRYDDSGETSDKEMIARAKASAAVASPNSIQGSTKGKVAGMLQ